MTTREELENLIKKKNDLIKSITDVCEILTEWELSLMDIIANEEQLKDLTEELRDTASEIIKTRQWLDFEESEPHF